MDLIPWDVYRQILGLMPIACVDVAIVSSGRILLVRRRDKPAKGELWLPGGRVIKGEMQRDTAARKAKEEVGIECHIGPMIYAAETIFSDGPDDIPIHSINSCFLLFPKDTDFNTRLDKHHDHLEWVGCIDDHLHPYVKSCLTAAGLGKGSESS